MTRSHPLSPHVAHVKSRSGMMATKSRYVSLAVTIWRTTLCDQHPLNTKCEMLHNMFIVIEASR